MSAPSIDLGKTILAKLAQNKLATKKQNPAANSARPGSKRGPPSSTSTSKTTGSNGKKSLASSSVEKTAKQKASRHPASSSDSHRAHKTPANPTSSAQAPPKPAKRASSSSPRPADKQQSVKRKKASSDVPPDEQSKSDHEGDEEKSDVIQDSDGDIDHRDVLLQEIKHLGGDEADLDLCAGSSSDEVEVQEDHAADPALVADLKSFMKGLDFAAALKHADRTADEDGAAPEPCTRTTSDPTDPPSHVQPTSGKSPNQSSSHANHRPNKTKKKKKLHK